MSMVYRAEDLNLGRRVALKFLPDKVAQGRHALQRFRREARAVAALNHPGICTLYEIGEDNGRTYLVLELLEGVTLKERVAAGPLALDTLLTLGIDITDALRAAHAKGIIHRDIKPANIFITSEGRAKILDFGVAKILVQAATGDTSTGDRSDQLTSVGLTVGTAAYMSPEQARGMPLDARTDLFSLGIVLYEMATGRLPFRGATAAAVFESILYRTPVEPVRLNPDVPPRLEEIINKCLEKNPELRYQHAADVGSELKRLKGHTDSHEQAVVLPEGEKSAASVAPEGSQWYRQMLAIVLITALAASAGAYWRAHRAVSAPNNDTAVRFQESGSLSGLRVAVLPFENLGPAEDNYFADGVADEVRTKLAAVHGLQVVGRASSTPYSRTSKMPVQIATELQATYLLTGTVRWVKSADASRVHVTPELVEVSGSSPPSLRWQQPFDAALTDVFQVQSDIASKVAQALGVALGAGDAKWISEKPTKNLAAYDAFLKGEEASNGMTITDPPSLQKALALYEQAVTLDAAFAQAWARVSLAAATLYGNSTSTPEVGERARMAAEKSLELAPDRPEGYWAFGCYQRLVLHDRNRAMEQYAKGQRLAPTNVNLLASIAVVEQSMGLWDAALEHARQAARIDPRSVTTKRLFGDILARLHRYREAREAFADALSVAPSNLGVIQSIAMTHLAEGDLAAARKVLAEPPPGVEPEAFVAFNALDQDLVWVLNEPQRQLLLRLTPSAFSDDRSAWALCRTQAYSLAGNGANVRASADQARKAHEEQLRRFPDDDARRVRLGLSLAFLGRKKEAIEAGLRGVAAVPITRDALRGAYVQHQLVRIYILVGEPEEALDALEPLLKVPYWLSPAWLRIDPNFDPLRKNPRFQKLVSPG
jgi:eukaryotic-like serine/threonine-protein kinase